MIPHGQDGRRAPDTLEEMAADYIREIQMLQPEGPYLLGGFSFGGLVAFEMAQQLTRAGQKVALLALLDPTPPHYGKRLNPEDSAFMYQSWREKPSSHWENLKSLNTKGRVDYLKTRLGWRFARLVRTAKSKSCDWSLRLGRRVPSRLRMFYFLEVSHRVAREYSLKPYPGPMSLLQTSRNSQDRHSVWAALAAGGIDPVSLPGQHMDVIQGDQVEAWGEALRSRLIQAQVAEGE
jgi:aspartate racemase